VKNVQLENGGIGLTCSWVVENTFEHRHSNVDGVKFLILCTCPLLLILQNIEE
jgi:hypothetical protein